MVYKSPIPTKEKKRLYRFMQSHKKRGVVGTKKLGKYLKKKGYKINSKGASKTARTSGYGKKTTMHWVDIHNKKGTKLAEIGIKSKKKGPRVVWWEIE